MAQQSAHFALYTINNTSVGISGDGIPGPDTVVSQSSLPDLINLLNQVPALGTKTWVNSGIFGAQCDGVNANVQYVPGVGTLLSVYQPWAGELSSLLSAYVPETPVPSKPLDDAGVAALIPDTGTATGAAVSAAIVATGDPRYVAPVARAVQLPKWRKALAQARNGSKIAKVACIGDSTTAGYGSTAPSAFLGGWPIRLARLLDSYFIPAAMGMRLTADSHDTCWTLGAGWAVETANNGFDGICYKGSASSGGLVFTPGATAGTFDTFSVYYIGNGATAPFTIQATGGSPVTVTPGTLNGPGFATCTAASGGTANAVTITTGTSPVRVAGVEPSLASKTGIRVANLGMSSASATGWAISGKNSPNYGAFACIEGYAPDLTIIDLGINDAASPSDTASFTTHVTSLVQAAQASGDVILKTFVPSVGDPLPANEALILSQIAAMSSSLGVPVIDSNARWVSHASANSLGMFFDTLHPNDIGYEDIAQQVFQFLTSF